MTAPHPQCQTKVTALLDPRNENDHRVVAFVNGSVAYKKRQLTDIQKQIKESRLACGDNSESLHGLHLTISEAIATCEAMTLVSWSVCISLPFDGAACHCVSFVPHPPKPNCFHSWPKVKAACCDAVEKQPGKRSRA